MNKYFKVVWKRKIIDLLQYEDKIGPIYVKYQEIPGNLIVSNHKEAQGFLSDNGKIYNLAELLAFPLENMYPTVSLRETTEKEYKQIEEKNFPNLKENKREALMELLGNNA